MTKIFSHCNWHIGDNLVHLHYLRKLSAIYPEHHFVHAANFVYLPQLIEAVADISNISLIDLDYKPDHSFDAWKNTDSFFDNHPNKGEYAEVYIDFFKYFSEKIGVESPIHKPSDLLFDYPAILKRRYVGFDYLIINSAPMSSQYMGFNQADFDELIGQLLEKGNSVITTSPSAYPQVPCTQRNQLSISAIGGLSLSCKYILGICNAPSWPTFNVWNTSSVLLRILLLDREQVLIAPNTEHAKNMSALKNILQERGLL